MTLLILLEVFLAIFVDILGSKSVSLDVSCK